MGTNAKTINVSGNVNVNENDNEIVNEIENENENEIGNENKIENKIENTNKTKSKTKSETKSETRNIVVHLKSGTGLKISLCTSNRVPGGPKYFSVVIIGFQKMCSLCSNLLTL